MCSPSASVLFLRYLSAHPSLSNRRECRKRLRPIQEIFRAINGIAIDPRNPTTKHRTLRSPFERRSRSHARMDRWPNRRSVQPAICRPRGPFRADAAGSVLSAFGYGRHMTRNRWKSCDQHYQNPLQPRSFPPVPIGPPISRPVANHEAVRKRPPLSRAGVLPAVPARKESTYRAVADNRQYTSSPRRWFGRSTAEPTGSHPRSMDS